MRKPIMRVGLLGGLALLPMSVAVAAEPGVNALNYPGPAWSPYVVGAGIGVLSWLTLYFSDHPIGASSFYAQIPGFLGKLIALRDTQSLAYFMAFGARLAGGCTSGHGISGTMQLNVASWIAVICSSIGGIAVAIPLFKMREKHD